MIVQWITEKLQPMLQQANNLQTLAQIWKIGELIVYNLFICKNVRYILVDSIRFFFSLFDHNDIAFVVVVVVIIFVFSCTVRC